MNAVNHSFIKAAHEALFGPFLTLDNAKTPFLALVGEKFPPFPLSVSTSSEHRSHVPTIFATLQYLVTTW